MNIPYVVESGENGETRHDIFSRMLKDRIIFLGSPIDSVVANVIVAQLLFLSSQDPSSPIKIYINSPGGSVVAGLSIIDTMNLIPNDVETIVVGMAASMAAVILSSGAKGMRKSLPNSTVMIHQPSNANVGGQASDIEISTRRIIRIRDNLNQMLASNTGQELSRVEQDCDRDYYMNSEEALEYGIIDSVVGRVSDDEEDVVGEVE